MSERELRPWVVPTMMLLRGASSASPRRIALNCLSWPSSALDQQSSAQISLNRLELLLLHAFFPNWLGVSKSPLSVASLILRVCANLGQVLQELHQHVGFRTRSSPARLQLGCHQALRTEVRAHCYCSCFGLYGEQTRPRMPRRSRSCLVHREESVHS